MNAAPTIEPLHLAAFRIEPQGPFSLEEAALFGFGQRHDQAYDGTMRLAFCVEGQELWALPTPAAITRMGPAGLAEIAGVEAARAERLCAVAAAALEGKLDAANLATMGTEQARSLLRTVPGIGPFYADLILVRATGVTDVLPLTEPRLLGLMGELWGLDGPATPAWASAKAESWSPWRTWVAVLVRAAAHRMAASRRDGVAS